jgi:HEPN domain-containing protein
MLKDLVQSYLSIDNEELLDDINDLYIDSRYPSSFGLLPHGKPSLEDAKEFYEFAQDIFNQVCTILNIDPEEVKK